MEQPLPSLSESVFAEMGAEGSFQGGDVYGEEEDSGGASMMVTALLVVVVVALVVWIVALAARGRRRRHHRHPHIHWCRTHEELARRVRDSNRCLVLFMSPYCGHCTQMMREYAHVARRLRDIPCLAVDVTAGHWRHLLERLGISGVPTLVLFRDGTMNEFRTYGHYERSADSIVAFARE